MANKQIPQDLLEKTENNPLETIAPFKHIDSYWYFYGGNGMGRWFGPFNTEQPCLKMYYEFANWSSTVGQN